MGWRDFQAVAPLEFMESMELITVVATPLIPLIPFIPKEAVDMTTGEVMVADTEPRQPVTIFEVTGDPVSCRFWKQVCWAVDFYQDACTRNSSCKIHKFLEANI